ncbi:4Fe-4S binding protein [Ideonella sp. TBM-1]|uniref:4Fe-4S binding protein n=1 Tax=Ideonella livida TaxID=2707176 RepID=A0A7C9PGQ4_9BURK|nr:4Fe-4S binding protein [Ideonella livida]
MQRRRLLCQLGFFALFLLAPALDLLRFDLTETQLWVLGQRWTLGLDALRAGTRSAPEVAAGLFWRALLPALVLVAAFLAVAWRWGRLYCGWLCPHFSLVEGLNAVLRRACGRLSLWERPSAADAARADARWWPVFGLLCLGFGFVWAFTLLSYLLPPARLWAHLLAGQLTLGEARFLGVATVVFTLEFALARHLFCRFGCAVGLFQSLVWMANPRGMVVAFRRERARDCRGCHTAAAPAGSACDVGCPLRLHPRHLKRMMFACVQCGRCLSACQTSQARHGQPPLLTWQVDADAVRETLRQRREALAHSPPPSQEPH